MVDSKTCIPSFISCSILINIYSFDCGVQFLLHDLRRTFATYADSLEIKHTTIKRLMNHKSNDVTSTHYIHQSTETLRKPMQLITDYILEQIK